MLPYDFISTAALVGLLVYFITWSIEKVLPQISEKEMSLSSGVMVIALVILLPPFFIYIL